MTTDTRNQLKAKSQDQLVLIAMADAKTSEAKKKVTDFQGLSLPKRSSRKRSGFTLGSFWSATLSWQCHWGAPWRKERRKQTNNTQEDCPGYPKEKEKLKISNESSWKRLPAEQLHFSLHDKANTLAHVLVARTSQDETWSPDASASVLVAVVAREADITTFHFRRKHVPFPSSAGAWRAVA